MDTVIDRPIFVVGSGRSGTTLLFSLLTKHPDLAWFSNWVNFHPDRPWLMALSRLWDIPLVGPRIAGRFSGLLHSDESIGVYTHCGMDHLHHQKRSPLVEDDVTPEAAANLRKMFATCQAYRGKRRFVNKNTNNCARVRYLNAVFPGAIFIHIIRDGRAVANSLLNVKWWPNLPLWWAGFTPNDWKREGKSPYELTALHWKTMVSSVLEAVPYLQPEQYIEVRYENLGRDPTGEMRRIIEFCGLRWTPQYEQAIKSTPVMNFNNKWKEQIPPQDQTILEDCLSDFLLRFGYSENV